MTPAVIAKFNEGKALYEGGAVILLPLLKAIQDGEDITGNSAEYKALVKAMDSLSDEPTSTVTDTTALVEPTVSTEETTDDLNDDGVVKGKILSEDEYWTLINSQRANSKK